CRWYKLRSKPGKKEKERGEIEVDIQFMRSNMTASMFDLSMKDKSRSAFGKLKDKLKGKRSSRLSDTASAIVPSTSHSPADSEDESVEKEKKKLKFKTLFSKPGLQKTSLSQSMSVLPTLPPAKEKVRLRPSDFQSTWDDEESETSPTSDKKSSSPVSKFHKIATLDSRHLNQITTSNTKKEGLSLFGGLKSKSDPVSKSSLCINGNHVYMEENTPKDNTPASSPSPLNFRRKQHFASEENLSSKFTKGPEEAGRTSPSGILSGSTSLETFKSMNLPSYKLLSSEDYTETHVPLTVDVVKENKKTDNKKSALFSLVTGKKETVKNSDVESVPDRTLKEEETKDSEGKSEKETKHLEIPTDLSKGNPFENNKEEEIFKNKQPLNPFEEDQKPEKAAVSAKTAQTKAVKPRLGVTSEEETKATLSIFAPDSLSAFLSARQISSDNNPFISKTGQKVEVPDSENITSSSEPLPLPGAELLSSKNPFISKWSKESNVLDSESVATFSLLHHLSASVPETSFSVQISSNGNNPFTSEWGQGSHSQDSESSKACASSDLSWAPSLRSDCHFNNNNPFVCKLGQEMDAAGLETVAGGSSFSLPCEEDSFSAENVVNLEHSLHGASGRSSDMALTSDVNIVSSSSNTCVRDTSLSKCGDNPLAENGAERLPPAKNKPTEKQETFSENRMEEPKPTLETKATPDTSDSLPQVAPPKTAVSICTLPPQEADVGRTDREAPSVSVTPKPAPRQSLMLKARAVVSQTDEFRGDVFPSDSNAKSAAGLPFPNEKPSSAPECPPANGSLKTVTPTVTLRGSNRHLKYEGDDLFGTLSNLKCAIPVAGDHGLKPACLPVILEGGSDEELLEDSQEDHNDDDNLLQAGKQSRDVMALSEELKEHSGTLPAKGSASDICNSGKIPVLPASLSVCSVNNKIALVGVTSHASEPKSHFERQELKINVGVDESAERDLLEPPAACSSVSGSSQSYSSSPSFPSYTQSNRAESSKKPTAEGSAGKAENSGKRKLLRAWVSPSETYPSQTQQGGEPMSPKHRLQPVKPMNAIASKSQAKNMNVISAMNDKLLEMSTKKYSPSDPGYAYAQLTHDELIQLVLKQKDTIVKKELQVRELEDYIDNLLVRVMEETPNILRVSTSGNKKAGKI
ncbi:RFIP1 protein, partial [Nothocercus nigrocapillus]|nr:RFIP1 protein [Nothocercus nigrocapillus]